MCVSDDDVPSNNPTNYGTAAMCQGDSGGPLVIVGPEVNDRFASITCVHADT